MKKQIISFFILIFTAAGLAAETGYEAYDWGENPLVIIQYEDNQKQKKTELWSSTYPPLIFEKELNGFKTNVFFIFNNSGYFNLVFYYTDIKNSKKIKDGLKNEVGVIKSSQFTEKDLLEKFPYVTQVTKDYIIGDFFISIINGTITPETGSGTITIYNYNDDTWCYVFENVLKDKTCVVYAPKE